MSVKSDTISWLRPCRDLDLNRFACEGEATLIRDISLDDRERLVLRHRPERALLAFSHAEAGLRDAQSRRTQNSASVP